MGNRNIENAEQQRAIDGMIKWLQIRGKHDENYYADWLSSLDPDAWHSDLLGRILLDEPVYDVPPPRAYSYPWTQLMEDGWSVGSKHTIPTETPRKLFGQPMLVIHQALWNIVAWIIRNGRQAWIVEYPKTKMKAIVVVSPNGMEWGIRIIK